MSAVSRVITVLVPLLLVAMFFLAVTAGIKKGVPEPIPARAALWLEPKGSLVEDRSLAAPIEAFLSGGQGEWLLSEVIAGIDAAAQDTRITALIMNLEKIRGPSLSQTAELSEALARFKLTGKPVVSVGDFYTQSQLVLAAQADSVLLHREGAVNLTGFASYRAYIKSMLDNIMINLYVFRAGENKSAVEPFLRDDMSLSEKQVVEAWLGSLWSDYEALLESGRGLNAGDVERFIEAFPTLLEEADGDIAETMLRGGLVDELMTHEQMRAHISNLINVAHDRGDTAFVDFERYRVNALASNTNLSKPVIAVVPIEGTLVPGISEQGFAGADTVVEQLDRAANQEGLAALVLRVNSPGGSVFASEVILDKIREIQGAGVPLVVSMGSVAASGGYYIAAEADEIWALPSTITGSIGAFAVFPTIDKLLSYIGVTVDGVATTQLAGSLRPDRPLDAVTQRILTSIITRVYREFTELVRDGRGLPIETVLEISEGKVWSGRQALEIGLIDKLGSLDAAIASAARLAEIDEWNAKRFGIPVSSRQLLLEELGRSIDVHSFSRLEHFIAPIKSALMPIFALTQLQDPRHLYLTCFDCVEPL